MNKDILKISECLDVLIYKLKSINVNKALFPLQKDRKKSLSSRTE